MIKRKMKSLMTLTLALDKILIWTLNLQVKWKANAVKKNLFVCNTSANNANCKVKP